MPASDNQYGTDQRDADVIVSPPMPQDAPLGINTPIDQSISSSSGSQPSFDTPTPKVVLEPREDLLQHNDYSYSQKPDSIVYNSIPINDAQQEAASPARPNSNGNGHFLHVTDGWLLEISSLVLCILSLVATIIILAKYDGKPIYDWPYKVTLNAVISVVATITQVAVMLPVTSSLSQLKWIWFNEKPRPLVDFETFDSASRGFWGSLLLLGRLRSMLVALGPLTNYTQLIFNRHWASLGAITSILALTTPPFTQQILTFKLVDMPTTTASINTALNFTQYKGVRASSKY